jgi:para-aminobenzoate synthetase component 1
MSICLIKSFDFQGDPLRLLDLFAGEPHPFLLDSNQLDSRRGRYSFIGFDPFEVFKGSGKDALALLKQRFMNYREGPRRSPTPLTCGVVGYLGYDYGLYQEKIRLRAKDDLGLPECCFGFYDCILTVDHSGQKLYITSSGFPEKGESLRQKRAEERLQYILKKFSSLETPSPLTLRHCSAPSGIPPLELLSNLSREEYLSAVRKALGYIEAGDIYQMNLSQRFTCAAEGRNTDPLEIYRFLRRLSPVSFGGYFDAGCFHLISNSPEMFLRLRGRRVQTRPMKGTRPRARDPREDRRLKSEIEQSAKDKAELLMITDLERNDLGRVCAYGSVRVKETRTIEEYNYVFQAVSLVEGTLQPGQDCFDLIEACFPGGSITGCPKIRAMEIIETLEPTRRGPYTGSLGYIDFAGNMDLNILIRTLLHCGEKIHFQVGGGIVADSTPEGEYEETLVKARAMQACLEQMGSYAQTGHLARR